MSKGQRLRRQQQAEANKTTNKDIAERHEKATDSCDSEKEIEPVVRNITAMTGFYFGSMKENEKSENGNKKSKKTPKAVDKQKKEAARPVILTRPSLPSHLEFDHDRDHYWYYDKNTDGYFYELPNGKGWLRKGLQRTTSKITIPVDMSTPPPGYESPSSMTTPATSPAISTSSSDSFVETSLSCSPTASIRSGISFVESVDSGHVESEGEAIEIKTNLFKMCSNVWQEADVTWYVAELTISEEEASIMEKVECTAKYWK